MRDQRARALAQILVRYSTRVQEGDVCVIQSTTAAEVLVDAVYQEVLRAGGNPVVQLTTTGAQAAFFEHASESQLQWVSPVTREWAAENADVRIAIMADVNARALQRADPRKQALAQKARKSLMEASMQRAAAGGYRCGALHRSASISGLRAFCARACLRGSAPERARAFISARIASDIGVLGGPLRRGRDPVELRDADQLEERRLGPGGELHDRQAAGAQHLLVDRLHQDSAASWSGSRRRRPLTRVEYRTRIYARASARLVSHGAAPFGLATSRVQPCARRSARDGRPRPGCALAHRDRVAVDLGEHLHSVAALVHPGRADEHGPQRPASPRPGRPRTTRAGARTRCGSTLTSSRPRCSRSSMISPAQVPSTGAPRARARAAARPGPRARCRASSWSTRRRGSRARRARRGRPGMRTSATSRAELARAPARAPRSRPGERARRSVGQPAALPAAVLRAGRRSPRGWRSRCPAIGRAQARARPRPRARGRRSAWWPRRSRARARSGSSDLKMPEPTKYGLGAELHHQRGVRRRGDAAGAKCTTGRRPVLGHVAHELERRLQLLRRGGQLRLVQRASRRISPWIARMWRTASTTLPVPASPLVRIIAAPSAMRRSASPRWWRRTRTAP